MCRKSSTVSPGEKVDLSIGLSQLWCSIMGMLTLVNVSQHKWQHLPNLSRYIFRVLQRVATEMSEGTRIRFLYTM